MEKDKINVITHSGDYTSITQNENDQDDHSCDDSVEDSLLTPVPILTDYNDSYSEDDSLGSENDGESTIKKRTETDPLHREDFDDFVTHAIPDPFGYESDNSSNSNQSDEDNFFIPTSDAGNPPFEIEKKR